MPDASQQKNDLKRIELAARCTASKYEELSQHRFTPHAAIYQAFTDFADEIAEQLHALRAARKDKPHDNP